MFRKYLQNIGDGVCKDKCVEMGKILEDAAKENVWMK